MNYLEIITFPLAATTIDATTTILLYLPFFSHILSYCLILFHFHFRLTMVSLSHCLSTRSFVDCYALLVYWHNACCFASDTMWVGSPLAVSASSHVPVKPQSIHSLNADCCCFFLFNWMSFNSFSSCPSSLISAWWLLTLFCCLLSRFYFWTGRGGTTHQPLLIFCCTIWIFSKC